MQRPPKRWNRNQRSKQVSKFEKPKSNEIECINNNDNDFTSKIKFLKPKVLSQFDEIVARIKVKLNNNIKMTIKLTLQFHLLHCIFIIFKCYSDRN